VKNSKIGIVTSNLGSISQTFVTRHIKKLNGGNNAILYKEKQGNDFLDYPAYKIKKPWWYNYSRPWSTIIQIPHFLRYSFNEVPEKNEIHIIEKFLVENNVKVLLAEFGFLGCMILPIAENTGIPVYSYFRGYDASKKLNDWKIRYAYKRLIPKMEGIISVSPHLLDNLKNIGVKWKEAHVIPSGTDVDSFKPGKKDNNLILSVGRFAPKKAPFVTIQAFAKVINKSSEAKLIMVGDGPLLQECKDLAHSLGVKEHVIFKGALRHESIQVLMAKASIFVLHSVTAESGNTEGFPSVIQEAMASGAVPVSTKHGGIPHFIDHGNTGLLVDEYDVNEYADQISNLLTDHSLLSTMSVKARKFAVNNFDYKKLYTNLEKILNSKKIKV